MIRVKLAERGWTQQHLARMMGRHRPEITNLISGKLGITAETAIALATVFDTLPQFWLELENDRQLSLISTDTEEVERRIRACRMAPIIDMEKRGWIDQTSTVEDLESELCDFFSVASLEKEPVIDGATRRSGSAEAISPSQRAWCFRVKRLAKTLLSTSFRETELDACKRELRKIAAYPQETHKVPNCLQSFGIRFVVVERLPGDPVDGVAIWLDENSPVIGMSLQHDRIDSFWHTLCHELSHIIHRDDAPLDCDLTPHAKRSDVLEVKDTVERRADQEAAETLITAKEITSFINRKGPMYSKKDIVRFAHRIKIHPGIIVGQLQHRHEIGYSANREMLAKVRDILTPAALTDGWGTAIDKGSLS